MRTECCGFCMYACVLCVCCGLCMYVCCECVLWVVYICVCVVLYVVCVCVCCVLWVVCCVCVFRCLSVLRQLDRVRGEFRWCCQLTALLRVLLTGDSREANNCRERIQAMAFATTGTEIKSLSGNRPYCFWKHRLIYRLVSLLYAKEANKPG